MGKEADSPQDGVKTPKEEEETPEPRAPPILEKEVDLTTDPTPASEDPEPEMTSRETDMIETWAETDLTEMTWEMSPCLKWEDKKYSWPDWKTYSEDLHLWRLDWSKRMKMENLKKSNLSKPQLSMATILTGTRHLNSVSSLKMGNLSLRKSLSTKAPLFTFQSSIDAWPIERFSTPISTKLSLRTSSLEVSASDWSRFSRTLLKWKDWSESTDRLPCKAMRSWLRECLGLTWRNIRKKELKKMLSKFRLIWMLLSQQIPSLSFPLKMRMTIIQEESQQIFFFMEVSGWSHFSQTK